MDNLALAKNRLDIATQCALKVLAVKMMKITVIVAKLLVLFTGMVSAYALLALCSEMANAKYAMTFFVLIVMRMEMFATNAPKMLTTLRMKTDVFAMIMLNLTMTKMNVFPSTNNVTTPTNLSIKPKKVKNASSAILLVQCVPAQVKMSVYCV